MPKWSQVKARKRWQEPGRTGGIIFIYNFGSFTSNQSAFNFKIMEYNLAMDKRFRDFAKEAEQ